MLGCVSLSGRPEILVGLVNTYRKVNTYRPLRSLRQAAICH
jgi:hypothetical protein